MGKKFCFNDVVLVLVITLFALLGCSEKDPSKQEDADRKGDNQSDISKAKEEILPSMQKNIEEFNKLTPDELKEKEKELKKVNTETRQAALGELIARFENIKKGALVNEVEAAFVSAGNHQFTVQREGRVYSCFSYLAGEEYWAKRAAEYYCLFEGTGLVRIVIPPPFEYAYVPYRGATREIQKPIDPDKRIDQTFSAVNLLDQSLIDSFKERFPEKSSSSNLGPLVGFAESFSASAKKQKEEDDFKRKGLEKKYNSAAVKLGMNTADVEAVLGSLKYMHKQNTKSVRIYGEEATFQYQPYSFPWIAIEYENEKVVRVMTRDFFNEVILK